MACTTLLSKTSSMKPVFFDWHPEIRTGYSKLVKNAVEVHIPKPNELAYERTEFAGVPFSTFIANKTVQGYIANYSLVLRGYVRTWLAQIGAEYDRVRLVDRLGRDAAAA